VLRALHHAGTGHEPVPRQDDFGRPTGRDGIDARRDDGLLRAYAPRRSALLAASATAFMVLKIFGALYLLWLAVDAVRHGSALNVRTDRPTDRSFLRSFLLGVGINLTNPKIVLFFVTFLPQFVDAGDPYAADKLLFLGLYFIAFSTPLAAMMIMGAERLVAALRNRPGAMRVIDYAFAGLFGASAIKILATSSR
jgi:threonine/homoserine/homoserine lactone efflux protein